MLFMKRLMAMAIVATAPLAARPTGPDVLIIVVPPAAGEAGATPHLDRLRDEGTVLGRCLGSAGAAATAAALLSGRHEFHNGVTDDSGGRNVLREEAALLPAVVAAAGYATAAIGKWPFADHLPSRPEDKGFDHVFVHGGGGVGRTGDRWGNRRTDPWMRLRSGWQRATGQAANVAVDEAARWLTEREEAASSPAFVWLTPDGTLAEVDAALPPLLAALRENTLAVVVSAKGGPDLQLDCFFRWPGNIAAAGEINTLSSVTDVFPTLAAAAGVALDPNWEGDGLDLSGALLGSAEAPAARLVFSHPGAWPAGDSADRHRSNGFSVHDGRWLLQGLDLFDTAADPGRERNRFEEMPEEAARLLMAYGQWWERVRPGLAAPVRPIVGDPRQPRVQLTAADWWPSRQAVGAVSSRELGHQATLRRTLGALAAGSPPVPETAGHWKIRVARDGHYQVRLAKLPAEADEAEQRRLAPLRAGTVHLRAGAREIRGQMQEGAPAAILGIDLSAGDIDLEAWMTGQLGGDRILGLFFATITRAGERKLPDFGLELGTTPPK